MLNAHQRDIAWLQSLAHGHDDVSLAHKVWTMDYVGGKIKELLQILVDAGIVSEINADYQIQGLQLKANKTTKEK